jgi:transposase
MASQYVGIDLHRRRSVIVRGLLAEAWIAPPDLRQLRELVRYRAKLVALRSGLKAQVHAVLAKEGVAVPLSDLFGKQGMQLLAETRLDTCYRMRVDSLLELIDAFDAEVAFLTDAIAARLRHHPGYHAIQQIPGAGPTFAAVFVVEIGDIGRFARPAQLCSWAELTPRHHESDATVIGGHVTKQGSRLVRWAADESVQVLPYDWKLRADRDRIAARRGRAVGKVAAARKLLTWCSTGCVTGTSATWTPPLLLRHEQPHMWGLARPVDRRRALAPGHDPRTSFGAVVV